MMTTNLKDIANCYFESWKKQDFEKIRSILSEDVNFVGVMGEAEGVDACIKGMQGLANIITDIVIQHMWIDESNILTWYELYTSKSPKSLTVANWCHIENDKIKKIRVTFDPRPLLTS